MQRRPNQFIFGSFRRLQTQWISGRAIVRICLSFVIDNTTAASALRKFYCPDEDVSRRLVHCGPRASSWRRTGGRRSLDFVKERPLLVLHDIKKSLHLPYNLDLLSKLKQNFDVTCVVSSSPDRNNWIEFSKAFQNFSKFYLPVLSEAEARDFVAKMADGPPSDASGIFGLGCPRRPPSHDEPSCSLDFPSSPPSFEFADGARPSEALVDLSATFKPCCPCRPFSSDASCSVGFCSVFPTRTDAFGVLAPFFSVPAPLMFASSFLPSAKRNPPTSGTAFTRLLNSGGLPNSRHCCKFFRHSLNGTTVELFSGTHPFFNNIASMTT